MMAEIIEKLKHAHTRLCHTVSTNCSPLLSCFVLTLFSCPSHVILVTTAYETYR